MLELIRLEKAYDAGSYAVRRLDLTIAKGEFVTLLGPSGCGKTTTLRMIAGFVRPTGGMIRLNHRLLADAERAAFVPPEARGMGMVFQSYAVWPHMTVAQNVGYPLRLRRMARAALAAKVAATLELVGLAGMADRFPQQLSGGQQQRVALARALIAEPDVLLLDEPLSNLDAAMREAMRGELIDLHRRLGMTVVYVTHDQAEALALSDRIVVMRSGEALQIGAPHAVYHAPAHRFIAEFIGAANLFPCRVETQVDNLLTVRLTDGEQVITLPARAAGKLPDEALLVIRPEQIRLHSVSGDGLRGRVRRVQFLGETTEITVQTAAHIVRARIGVGAAPPVGSDVVMALGEGWVIPPE